MKFPLFSLMLLGAMGSASAAKIGVMSSGDPATDTAVLSALTTEGHTPTLLPLHFLIPRDFVFWQYDAIYLQPNFFWAAVFETSAEINLLNYVRGGGGLVTAEWTLWGGFNSYPYLWSEFPGVSDRTYDVPTSIVVNKYDHDPVVHAGLANTLTLPLDNIAGGSLISVGVRQAAKIFYGYQVETRTRVLVVGGDVFSGRIVNFATVNGTTMMADANFRRLFGNVFRWVSGKASTGPGIQGRYTLRDCTDLSRVGLVVSYISPTTNLVVGQSEAQVDSQGFFTAQGPANPGTYRILLKSRTGLSRRLSSSITTQVNQTPNVGSVTAANGDVDGDNQVTIFDYIDLSNVFDLSLGDPGFDRFADLDLDDSITVFDYIALSNSFDQTGE